jgi:outer membrane lipoprotein LolB
LNLAIFAGQVGRPIQYFTLTTRFAFTTVLLTLLASCTGLQPQMVQQPADWSQRLAHNSALSSWQLQGRLGIQTATEGGSFDLFWEQTPDKYSIRLLGPMGQGAMLINGDADGVRVKTADGERFDKDADRLFAEATGIELPLAGLKDWLRGMPIQQLATDTISWNEQGQLYRLTQNGWKVEMNRYKDIDGYELPHKFYIEREDRPELAIRLVILRWSPQP